MRNLLVVVALTGLSIAAIMTAAWSWLAAVAGMVVAVILGRSTRLMTRIQLVFVGSLAGGIGAKAVRTTYLVMTGAPEGGGLYRQVLTVSLGSIVVVLAAMIAENLVTRWYPKMDS